ncbi:MAG: helix-turn-helix transcriptional regulator [Caldilineaceae bacterium]|nr:helix-turn-helix transcriptional regulator [Caldilineaceae bacterium]
MNEQRETTLATQKMTRREREVCALAARGLRQVEIARRLVISVETARVHERNIRQKLGVASRGELIARLAAQGVGKAGDC